MPKTAKGREIFRAMKKEYGAEKGERVFYASRNKGTITGVDAMLGDTIVTAKKPKLLKSGGPRPVITNRIVTARSPATIKKERQNMAIPQTNAQRARGHTMDKLASTWDRLVRRATGDAWPATGSIKSSTGQVRTLPVKAKPVKKPTGFIRSSSGQLRGKDNHGAAWAIAKKTVADSNAIMSPMSKDPNWVSPPSLEKGMTSAKTVAKKPEGTEQFGGAKRISGDAATTSKGPGGDYTGHASSRGGRALHTTTGHPDHQAAAKAALSAAPKAHSIQTGRGYNGSSDMRFHRPDQAKGYKTGDSIGMPERYALGRRKKRNIFGKRMMGAADDMGGMSSMSSMSTPSSLDRAGMGLNSEQEMIMNPPGSRPTKPLSAEVQAATRKPSKDKFPRSVPMRSRKKIGIHGQRVSGDKKVFFTGSMRDAMSHGASVTDAISHALRSCK